MGRKTGLLSVRRRCTSLEMVEAARSMPSLGCVVVVGLESATRESRAVAADREPSAEDCDALESVEPVFVCEVLSLAVADLEGDPFENTEGRDEAAVAPRKEDGGFRGR